MDPFMLSDDEISSGEFSFDDMTEFPDFSEDIHRLNGGLSYNNEQLYTQSNNGQSSRDNNNSNTVVQEQSGRPDHSDYDTNNMQYRWDNIVQQQSGSSPQSIYGPPNSLMPPPPMINSLMPPPPMINSLMPPPTSHPSYVNSVPSSWNNASSSHGDVIQQSVPPSSSMTFMTNPEPIWLQRSREKHSFTLSLNNNMTEETELTLELVSKCKRTHGLYEQVDSKSKCSVFRGTPTYMISGVNNSPVKMTSTSSEAMFSMKLNPNDKDRIITFKTAINASNKKETSARFLYRITMGNIVILSSEFRSYNATSKKSHDVRENNFEYKARRLLTRLQWSGENNQCILCHQYQTHKPDCDFTILSVNQ
jgi:hypothetical protein